MWMAGSARMSTSTSTSTSTSAGAGTRTRTRFRRLIAVVLVAATAGLLAGCAPGAEPAPGTSGRADVSKFTVSHHGPTPTAMTIDDVVEV
jgi:hypothetical protein